MIIILLWSFFYNMILIVLLLSIRLVFLLLDFNVRFQLVFNAFHPFHVILEIRVSFTSFSQLSLDGNERPIFPS